MCVNAPCRTNTHTHDFNATMGLCDECEGGKKWARIYRSLSPSFELWCDFKPLAMSSGRIDGNKKVQPNAIHPSYGRLKERIFLHIFFFCLEISDLVHKSTATFWLAHNQLTFVQTIDRTLISILLCKMCMETVDAIWQPCSVHIIPTRHISRRHLNFLPS